MTPTLAIFRHTNSSGDGNVGRAILQFGLKYHGCCWMDCCQLWQKYWRSPEDESPDFSSSSTNRSILSLSRGFVSWLYTSETNGIFLFLLIYTPQENLCVHTHYIREVTLWQVPLIAPNHSYSNEDILCVKTLVSTLLNASFITLVSILHTALCMPAS